MDFRLGERQQWDRRHPSSKRIGNCRHGGDVGGAGQKKPARPIVAIHAFLDRQHQLRHALDFIDHSPLYPLTKPTGSVRAALNAPASSRVM